MKPKSAPRLLKIGDVLLHECGQRMTVTEFGCGSVFCTWFDTLGENLEGWFALNEFIKDQRDLKIKKLADLLRESLKHLDQDESANRFGKKVRKVLVVK